MDKVTIQFAGTFELAQWCKLLRDRGATGHQVAFALGRSEGYVNNLIRILERASLPVLLRWRAEQLPQSPLPHICATDWLMQTCVLPHDVQTDELARRIAVKTVSRDASNDSALPAGVLRSPARPGHATGGAAPRPDDRHAGEPAVLCAQHGDHS